MRLAATPEASTTLRRWFGSARWTYTQCLCTSSTEGPCGQGNARSTTPRRQWDASQSLTIHHKHWKHTRGAYTEHFAGVHATDALPDGRLTRSRLGQRHM